MRKTIAALVAALVACSQGRAPQPDASGANADAARDADAGAAGVIEDAAVVADASSANDGSAPSTGLSPDAAIVVAYSACFGTCQPYTLTLAGDGTFRGGVKPVVLAATTTAEVFELAETAFTPLPTCGGIRPDSQRVTVTYVKNGKKRSLQHLVTEPCSKAVGALEQRMNALRTKT